MRKEPFNSHRMPYNGGITLIELLIALVIFGTIAGAVYRLSVNHTQAYAIQDQVVEVQQDIRVAMDIILRDLRMAGFQTSTFNSSLITNGPIVYPLSDNSITVTYEYIDPNPLIPPATDTVTYTFTGGKVIHTSTLHPDPPNTPPLLKDVGALTFTYAIDQDGDGNIDDGNNDGVIDGQDFLAAANVGTARVLAVRVALTANPSPDFPDISNKVSPRTLTSAATLRNMSFKRSQAY
jgi:prepilin-type N-terminal cleavage/methylation domain-containing protein